MQRLSSLGRVRAPDLSSDSSVLRDLRGRFVLLHFFTSSCANCLHVLDELRPLEAARGDVLTVLGVHSPKFSHESSPQAVQAAIARYGIEHRVVPDPELHAWREYAIKAWPTLVLLDPEGYVVAQAAGEGHVAGISELVDELVPHYAERGTLRRASQPSVEPMRAFAPAGAIVLPGARNRRDTDTLLVADTAGHRLVQLSIDGRTELDHIGSGRGEPFTAPAGLTLPPVGLTDYDVLVADTGAHVLRGVRLDDGEVVRTIDLPTLVSGLSTVTGPVPGVVSPWDVAWWPALERVVIAAAGVHLLLSLDLTSGTVEVLAGTTVEGLRDGPALDGWLAQPSGLAVDGDRVWFVDAETSALRWLSVDGTLHTAVGEGLFDFGLVDGPPDTARMQHPLGLTTLPDGSIAVADTFNGAVRVWLPQAQVLATLASGFAEPASLVVDGERVVVTESAAGRVGALALPRPVTLRPGRVRLNAVLDAPTGQVPDDRDGPATRLTITASPASVLSDGVGTGTDLERDVSVAGAGVLCVTAQLASCDDPSSAHPACHVTRTERTFVVGLDAAGSDTLTL